MSGNIQQQQPATHSLLRASQSRRQQQQQSPSPNHHQLYQNTPNNNNKQKYHFNYTSKSFHNQSNHENMRRNQQNVRLGLSSSAVREGRFINSHHQHNIRQADNNNNRSMVVPSSSQKIVVCQSQPKTRPKYSFTFNHPPVNNNNNSNKNITSSPINNNSIITPSSIKPQSANIRRDMDICLYSITDKLLQTDKPPSTLLDAELNQSPMPAQYKPSISQIRKNKKLYLDRSIHRIHPDIVNEYIETVYREYDIPDPLRGSVGVERRSGEVDGRQQRKGVQVTGFRVGQGDREERLEGENNKQDKEDGQRVTWQGVDRKQDQWKSEDYNRRQGNKELINYQPVQRPAQQVIPQPSQPPSSLSLSQPKKQQSPPQQQYYLHNTKTHHRRNNLIQEPLPQSPPHPHHPSTKPPHQRRKTFLNLTLSRQKDLLLKKTFQSPQKPHLHQPQREQLNKSRSQKSKQRSQSASQKKILQIKKNISTWNDHEHQYAERYSYLESPYEVISKGEGKREMERERGTKERGEGQKVDEGDKEEEVNVRIRPFEEMMRASLPTQHLQPQNTSQFSKTHHQNTTMFTQQSHPTQTSKYIPGNTTFFTTPDGQLLEEFRFCILCQLPVLSANIWKHEEKCIGWISEEGRLVTFGDLYRMEGKGELRGVMVGKVREIGGRLMDKMERVKERQGRDCREDGGRDRLGDSILQSVQAFIHSFASLKLDNPQDQNQPLTHPLTRSSFSTCYHHLQKTYNNEHLLLLQESKKLHWFVKLLENYEHRLMNGQKYEGKIMKEKRRDKRFLSSA